MNQHECDVVVGLCAALAALQGGATLIILERACEAERGGNTRYTTSALRMRSEDEVAEDFEMQFADNAGYHLDPALVAQTAADYGNWPSIVKTMNMTDPDLVTVFAERAADTLAWLKTHGVRYAQMPYYGLTERSAPRIGISGGGYALVETLCPLIEQAGGRFIYRTTARSLMRNDNGAVRGLSASDSSGDTVTISCRSVVLACGGFQGNAEMVARYIGEPGRYIRPVARGGYSTDGVASVVCMQPEKRLDSITDGIRGRRRCCAARCLEKSQASMPLNAAMLRIKKCLCNASRKRMKATNNARRLIKRTYTRKAKA